MMRVNEIKKIIKYILASGSSFFLDICLFTLINYLLGFLGSVSIIIATILARIISSLYNYFINSRYVFGNFSKTSIVKYYILVVIQMFNSALLVYMLSFKLTMISDTIIKVFVDVVIFVINYVVQKKVVFK